MARGGDGGGGVGMLTACSQGAAAKAGGVEAAVVEREERQVVARGGRSEVRTKAVRNRKWKALEDSGCGRYPRPVSEPNARSHDPSLPHP
jgi:hypothetical protein